jgi:hypothetical protein
MVLVVQRDQHLRQRFTSTRERPTQRRHDHLMLQRRVHSCGDIAP